MKSASPRSCTLECGMHPSTAQALLVCEIQIDADAAITGKV